MQYITKRLSVGGLAIGGGAPISVQSMLNTPAHDFDAGARQARELEQAGCQLVRAAIPDMAAVPLIAALKQSVSIPVVADIHFDYRLAIESVNAGADKIRINPGNIGSADKVRAVADTCRRAGIPIRIGVNSGSLEKEILAKYGKPCPQALRDSALFHADLLEQYDFSDIIISVKSSSVVSTVHAYRLVADALAQRQPQFRYPLHVGVTEAGTERMGIIKSSAGIGALLLDSIGDTIRVSLTADPVREAEAAVSLLKALEMRGGINIISCPTCGRTQVDLISMATEVERRCRALELKYPSRGEFTAAVMGCVVNGPGEAGGADVGLAGGNGKVAIFRQGGIIRTVDEKHGVDELMQEIEQLLLEKENDLIG